MQLRRPVLLALIVVCLGSACSDGAIDTKATPADLRTAARSYAAAYIGGDAAGFTNAFSTHCDLQHHSAKDVQPLLRQLRGDSEGAQRLLAIKVVGAEVRNVSRSKGTARALFQGPPSDIGNDNWLHYVVEDGEWRLRDCKNLPIPVGGSTVSVSGRVTSPVSGG